MYYALIDTMTRPSNPGHGFCNSKKCVTFATRAERDAYVTDRSNYDFSCRALSRREAMPLRDEGYDGKLGFWDDEYVNFVIVGPQR